VRPDRTSEMLEGGIALADGVRVAVSYQGLAPQLQAGAVVVDHGLERIAHRMGVSRSSRLITHCRCTGRC
jgi:hypothetical protein